MDAVERQRGPQIQGNGQEARAPEAPAPGRSTLVQARGSQPALSGPSGEYAGEANDGPKTPRWAQLKSFSKKSDAEKESPESEDEELGEGKPLEEPHRAKFQQSLGRDLSQVRVHDGPQAAASAEKNDARAYAQGDNIVFNKGEYQPGDQKKDKLLAHEVAHTVQQSGGAPSAAPATTTPGDSVEKNADAAAGAMTQGAPASVDAAPVSIARKAKGEADAPADVGGGDAGGGAMPAAMGPAANASEPKNGGPGANGQPAAETAGGGGDFAVQLLGTTEGEKPDVAGNVPGHDLEAGKAELAGIGQKLPASGAEGIGADGVKIDVDHGAPPPANNNAPIPKELAEQILHAQEDTRAAVAESEGQSAAYKAEIKAKRDGFEDEQHATMLESLKTMSATDKRSTLKDMGYDEKALKKIKDSQLDGIISGKMETEQRKNKIMGMDPDELKALAPGQKIQYLVDLGIDRGDLDKAGQSKACKLFDDVMAVAHVPGEHTCKIKISGGFLGVGKKDWVVNVKVDLDGNATMDVKKEGGWLSKLWGWVKAALPIIAVVLAPITGGASLIALAVYQAAVAIKQGNWLGAIVGAATALVGLGAAGAAGAFAKVADVAKKVKDVATAAQATLAAAKAKNAGSLLAALAGGASAFAGFAAGSADKLAKTMQGWSDKLKKWSAIVGGGEKVVQGIKSGDPIGAISGAFDTAAGVVGPVGKGAKNIERAQNITGFVNSGKRALSAHPPDYGAVASAAMGIANQLKQDRRLEDAGRIVNAASRLEQAWKNKDANPGGLADAALDLASAVQVAKYDADHPAEKDADGKDKPDQGREAVLDRYSQAQRVVRAAGSAIQAAMAKPRPNYIAALDAGTQLVQELTGSKKVDEAAKITARLSAWTAAVNSKNEQAILEAGMAFGTAVNDLRDTISDARAKAKKEAEAQLQPGDKLPEGDAGEMPRFETTIEVKGEAPVVPLIAPGLITELDPSELLGDGGKTGKSAKPGADTDGTQAGPAQTQGPKAPQPHVDVDVEYKLGPQEAIPQVYKDLLSLTQKFAEFSGWPGSMQALLAQVDTAFSTYEKLHKEGKTTLDAYKKAKAVLDAAASGTAFADAVVKRFAGFEGDFGDLNKIDPSNQALRTLTTFSWFVKGLSKTAKIPLNVMSAMDNFIVMCGVHADGSPASKIERAAAANSLTTTAIGLGSDLKWLYTTAQTYTPGLTGSIEAAVATVRAAAQKVFTKFGTPRAAETVTGWCQKALQACARIRGVPKAMELAEKMAATILEWGASRLAVVTTNEMLQEIALGLGKALGYACESTMLLPVQLAYEYIKFEIVMTPQLYHDCKMSLDQILSQKAFGKMANQLKAEITAFSTGSPEDCDRLFQYADHEMLKNGMYADVKANWHNAWFVQLPSLVSDVHFYQGSTIYGTLHNFGLDVKRKAAEALKQVALNFVDIEMKRIFGH
jgi:hypothetical protein